MIRRVLLALGLITLSVVSLAQAADWLRFRGPDGSATSNEKNLPLKWSASENIAWQTELPGPGTSSPIVVGDKIYLTCYTGYGLDHENPGEQANLMRHVVCLDRKSGKIAWQRDFKPELPESDYKAGNDGWHGYSSSTLASDGERLYAFFGKSGVYGLDMQGQELWHASVGNKATGWGSANSPVLFENLVIVNAAIESNSLVALNKMTGEEVWKVGSMGNCRNTPILVKLADGKTELVLNQPNAVVGYDPGSGMELWRCKGIPDGYVCPSAVAHDGVVYVIGGRKNTAIAVKAGGRGDVNESHVLWNVPSGSNVSSPVYHEGHIYWMHERSGTANCLDAKTGETVYQERVEPRPGIVYSSVTVADGKLYYVSQHNGTYVLPATPKFELLAHNELDKARTNASPVVHNGQLLIRNDKYLYCIGK